MRPVIRAQIARFCVFQERQCRSPDTAQLSQHGFFAGKQLRVDWDRRLAANQALLHDYKWDVKSLQIRNGKRHFANDAAGIITEDATLDLAKVRDYVCSGPGIRLRGRAPVGGGD